MVRGERQPNFRYGLRTVVEGSGVKSNRPKNCKKNDYFLRKLSNMVMDKSGPRTQTDINEP
jgi:hypothetical protein